MGILEGVYLPIVTPFYNDEVDYESYDTLIRHYLSKGITGLIPLGTTGESPAIEDYEFEKIVDRTLELVDRSVPVFVGVGGNITRKVLPLIKKVERHNVDGILSVCPYYNRPSQRGLYEHFLKISEATALRIIIYNIPYRTGVNLQNEALLRLAEEINIVGVKDSCGDLKQTLELLSLKPDSFSVLTGEDILFYTTVVNGGDGGILAASHLKTETFLDVYRLIRANDHQAALHEWRKVSRLIPLLFEEPNPGPIKYYLRQSGLIRSEETRLPITGISEELKERLDSLQKLSGEK